MDLENTFRLCAHGGRADVVKVVTTAFCLEDAIRLVHVAKNVVLPGNPPKIILAMGAVGQVVDSTKNFVLCLAPSSLSYLFLSLFAFLSPSPSPSYVCTRTS